METSWRLGVEGSADLAAVLDFFADRAVPGIEAIEGSRYSRSLRLAHGPAVLSVDVDPGPAASAGRSVEVSFRGDARDLAEADHAARRLCGLDRDAAEAVAALAADPALDWAVEVVRGVRSPGYADGAELAMRTVIGQQISIKAARTHLGRLVAEHGTDLPPELHTGSVTRLFPESATIAALSPADFRMPVRRGETIVRLAEALAEGVVDLGPGASPAEAARALSALRGIGPWTVGYIRMRVLDDPDVFLSSDLWIAKAIERVAGRTGIPAADLRDPARWSPWGTHASHVFWALARD